jgi:heat shock protein HslJ
MKTIFIACLILAVGCQNPSDQHFAAGTDSAAGSGSTPMGSAAVTKAAEKPDTTTLGGQWYLLPVLASDTATGKIPEIRFDLVKSHFSGNTGCNNMNGEFWFSTHDSSLSFAEKFAMTRIACTGYNEQGFIKSLKNTNHYRLKKGTLILMSDATELSRWARREAVPARTGKA